VGDGARLSLGTYPSGSVQAERFAGFPTSDENEGEGQRFGEIIGKRAVGQPMVAVAFRNGQTPGAARKSSKPGGLR
jgi:hypothetical protein